MTFTLAWLEEQYPHVPWREPIRLTVAGFPPGYDCRICIANLGKKGNAGPWFPDEATARAHLRDEHGVNP